MTSKSADHKSIKKRKGTVSFIGVSSDGEEYTYEFQQRELQKEELNDLLCLTRGDIITMSDMQDTPDHPNNPFTQDGTDQSYFYAQVWEIVRIKKEDSGRFTYFSSITLISKSRVPFTSPTTVRKRCLVRKACNIAC